MGSGWSRWIAGCALLGFLTLGHSTVVQAVSPSGQATVSRQAREEAIRNIPFQLLDQQTQQKLSAVVSKPTIYRRLPTRTIECDPDMFLFLVRHPEVVVNIWELMDVTNVNVQRTGQYTMRATDGAGTTTDVELVYGSRNQHVIFAEGYYDGPLTRKRLTGRCVMLLSTAYQAQQDREVRVTNQLDVFLQLDNVGADLLARTLHPLVGRTADHNFVESAGFLEQLSAAAQQNPAGVQRLAQRLESVQPELRTQFAGLAAVVAQRAILRSESWQTEQPGLVASEPSAGEGNVQAVSSPLPISASSSASTESPGSALPRTAPPRGRLELRR